MKTPFSPKSVEKNFAQLTEVTNSRLVLTQSTLTDSEDMIVAASGLILRGR
jgi:hypothetical protein